MSVSIMMTGKHAKDGTECKRDVRKRIIICCDGTFQSAVSGKKSSPSNIARLTRSLVPHVQNSEKYGDKEWMQVVWYDSGVGTTSGKLGQQVEGAFGNGLEGNVIEAYNFVALNYNPGDEVMCFGFSRGAYTARAIAGLISDIGICGRQYLHEFHELWAVYTDKAKRKAGERFCGSDAYFDFIDGQLADPRVQPETQFDNYDGYNYFHLNWDSKPHFWLEDPKKFSKESRYVEVVGVYDTVGSLGFPGIRGWHPFGNGPEFHNVALNKNIKNAYHALALDEHREAFSPTLYSVPAKSEDYVYGSIEAQEDIVNRLRDEWFKIVPSKTATAQEKADVRKVYIEARRRLLELQENALPQSTLKQVWFPGMHINSGGGSNDTLEARGDLEQTSNITFAWMLEQLRNHLDIDTARVKHDNEKIKAYPGEHNTRVEVAEKVRKLEEEAARKESWAQSAQRFGRYMGSVANSINPWGTTPPNAPPKNNKKVPTVPGWATGDYVESYNYKYVLNGSVLRTPGQYSKNPDMLTNEEVHPTVGWRMAKLAGKYKPLPDSKGNSAVKRERDEYNRYRYIINGVTLPEYKIMLPEMLIDPKEPESYERLVIPTSEEVGKFVAEFDGLNRPILLKN